MYKHLAYNTVVINLRKEHTFKMSEKNLPNRIFKTKRDAKMEENTY
jgi:hypothetical protein